MPRREIDKIGGISDKFDVPMQNRIQSGNVSLVLLDKGYKWLPSNTASGVWRKDATATVGYDPIGSEFTLSYGYILADETEEYLSEFVGVINDDLKFDSKSGTVTIQLVAKALAQLETADAGEVGTTITDGTTSPANGDGVVVTFSTQLKSLWRVFNVRVGGVLKTQGTHYTLDDLNDAGIAASIVFDATAIPGASAILLDGNQWYRDKSISTLVGYLCDEAGISAGNREISEPIFAGVAGSKTIDSQADWEAGTVLAGIDTTTAPGSISAPTTSFAYTGSEASWVVPAGVTEIYVDMKGPGGGGGAAGVQANAGGGGGGGVGAGSPGGTGASLGGLAGANTYVKRGATTLAQAAIGAGGGGGAGGGDPGGAGGAGGTDEAAGLTATSLAGGAGGAGGTNTGNNVNGTAGTAGNKVVGAINVTPGETLTIHVGGGGGGASNGGGASSGASGSNGSLSITGSTVVYESAIFDIISTPTAWGNLDRTETLNGGTLTYSTASSTDGISFDAYVAIIGGVIQSALKRYFKVKVSFAPLAGASSPVVDKLIANFATSELFVRSADFTGQTCLQAVQSLAILGGMEFGQKGNGVFFFRSKSVAGNADLTISQKNVVIGVTDYSTGYRDVRNNAQVRYGKSGTEGYYFSEYAAANAGEASPTTAQRFGEKVISLDLQRLIFSNDAQVADAVARKLYELFYRPRRKLKLKCRIIPHLDLSDKVSVSFHDSPLIEKAIFGDPLQRFPVTGPNAKTLARDILMKVVGHSPDLMKSESTLDLEEIL